MDNENRLKSILIRIKGAVSPLQKIVLSFVLLITLGAGLLLLPWSHYGELSLIDAFFTSTSAVCVTGLIVVDTAAKFTLTGKTILLTLIQFGGLGIMTFSIALLSLLGGSYSIKWRFTFTSFYSDLEALPIKSVLKRIILYTALIETVTALFLFSRFVHYFPVPEALGHAVFHAISAFCNAGFSSFSENLVTFRHDALLLLTTCTAVILGGLGFLVLTEFFRKRKGQRPLQEKRFSLHTRIVLVMTGFLLVYGTLSILTLEWDYALKEFTLGDKILTAFFHSVSCRTAGFNTIDIGTLRESTLFTLIGLMFIGGSPGSIAGGIKTTTIAVILGVVIARFMGRRQVVFQGRALGHGIIDRSTSLIILSGLFIYFSTFMLLFLHSFDINHTFLSGFFEITSAFGTVGLSTGITSTLYTEGKILIILVMFTGRLGPLVLITALTARRKNIPYEYPEETIMIG